MGSHEQTGIAGCFSVDEYERDVIRKHERTRKDKEDDRTRHLLTLGAQTGPVFLTYPAVRPRSTRSSAGPRAGPPLFDFTAGDGVQHTLWRLGGGDRDAVVAAFDRIPLLYIADGHHRAASAMRARQALRETAPGRRPDRGRRLPGRGLRPRPDAGPGLSPGRQGPGRPDAGRHSWPPSGPGPGRARQRLAGGPGRGVDVPRRPLACADPGSGAGRRDRRPIGSTSHACRPRSSSPCSGSATRGPTPGSTSSAGSAVRAPSSSGSTRGPEPWPSPSTRSTSGT